MPPRTNRSDDEENKRQRVSAFVFVQARGNKQPDLAENKRGGQEDCGHHRQFQFEVEALRSDSMTISSTPAVLRIGTETTLKRVSEQTVQHNAECDSHGDQAVDDALSQFLEMIEERHLPA